MVPALRAKEVNSTMSIMTWLIITLQSEEKRRELLQLGLPDDGYDYTRHLKELAPRAPGGMTGPVQVQARVSCSAALRCLCLCLHALSCCMAISCTTLATFTAPLHTSLSGTKTLLASVAKLWVFFALAPLSPSACQCAQ